MNRPLTILLVVAAVVGATTGTVVATSLGGDSARQGPTDPASSVAGTSPAAPVGPPGPGAPGDVLWADQTALHDGDLEVPIDLGMRPLSVERAEGGWVVTSAIGDEGGTAAYFVTPEGDAIFFAGTAGEGDVSPDGTRYVAASNLELGFQVWDVRTGTPLDVPVDVPSDGTPGQLALGGAQFVDDDTVAVGITDPDFSVSVVQVDLGDGALPRTLVEGVDLGWAISPDGRWLAATTPDPDQVPGVGCALLRDLDDLDDLDTPERTRTECGYRFPSRPSFATDGSAALALLGGDPAPVDASVGPWQPLLTDEGPLRPLFQVPEHTLDVAFLDQTQYVVLTSLRERGGGTRIQVCEGEGRCRLVGSSDEDADTAVLGTST